MLPSMILSSSLSSTSSACCCDGDFSHSPPSCKNATTSSSKTAMALLCHSGGCLLHQDSREEADEKYRKRHRQQTVKFYKRTLLVSVAVITSVVTWTYLSLSFKFQEQEGNHDGQRYANLGPSNHDRAQELKTQLLELEHAVQENVDAGTRWVAPELLLSLDPNKPNLILETDQSKKGGPKLFPKFDLWNLHNPFFRVQRLNRPGAMKWQQDAEFVKTAADIGSAGSSSSTTSYVDYTKHDYDYPDITDEVLSGPPSVAGSYPPLKPLEDLLRSWPQDELDSPPSPAIQETLIHFDFQNPKHMEAAMKYRDAKLPFKLVNVPEILAVNQLWTDEYLQEEFKVTPGTAQESPNNFFAFFSPNKWDIERQGMPPTRSNDWDYTTWSRHARYADAVQLSHNAPHFYWQSGVDRSERHLPQSKQSFITKGLPSFSSLEPTFFAFEPQYQKGIQCRFGERGVTAATHYDAGQNMVAMITGAKRYILSPPNQCRKLGIVTSRDSPIFRHSMLNFGHLSEQDDTTSCSQEEKDWMQVASKSLAVETVLKAGEVLFLPSYWFHYITSLQKSAQCNVRSGADNVVEMVKSGSQEMTSTREYFGSVEDVRDGCVI